MEALGLEGSVKIRLALTKLRADLGTWNCVLDPDNATWKQMWPALDNLGRARFDDRGRVQTSTTTCTKR